MYFVFVIVANLYVTVTDSNKSNNTALQCTSPEVSEMIYRICMQRKLYLPLYPYTSVILLTYHPNFRKCNHEQALDTNPNRTVTT